MSALGLVVIGRNEGERLRRCLATVKSPLYPVVYVDSASADGSASLARELGCDVVELDRRSRSPRPARGMRESSSSFVVIPT